MSKQFDFSRKQSFLFERLARDVIILCHNLGLNNEEQVLNYLSKFWLPLGLDLATTQRELGQTLIVGVLGSQGTGKTILCIVLKFILGILDCSAANLSLDDLYLTYEERKQLQRQDPRLLWRGPPGTHDVQLGLKVIEQCLQSDFVRKIALPRFDKSAFNGSGDRTIPETIVKPDILMFEGWFVGIKPIPESCFNNPPAPIMTSEDIQFAKDSNRRLKAYLPLWSKLDRLIILAPEDYRLSKQWRKDAERKMIAAGKTGMSDEECDHFVEYFWKSLHPELFIKPLTKTADLVVEIKNDRTLGNILSRGEIVNGH